MNTPNRSVRLRSKAYGRMNPHRIRVFRDGPRVRVFRGPVDLGDADTFPTAWALAGAAAGSVHAQDCVFDSEGYLERVGMPAPLEVTG